MKKVKWIKRALIENPFCVGICQSEKAFKAECKRLKVPKKQWPKWVPEGKNGTVHYFRKVKSHDQCTIICIDKRGGTPAQVAGLLVHEAVHVWQAIRDDLNEKIPSPEFEAYAVQNIAQGLIAGYKGKKR